MSKFPQEVYSQIFKQNSEKKVDKMLRKLVVKSTILSDKKHLLERLNFPKSRLRQEPRNQSSKESKDSKFKSRKLRTIKSN